MSLSLGLSLSLRGSGSGGPTPAPVPSPVDVLGSRLKAFFLSSYSGGTWTSDVGSATLVQATIDNRPTAITLPSGDTALDCDGTDDYLTAGTAISLSSGGYRLLFCIFRNDGAGSCGLLGSNSTQYLIADQNNSFGFGAGKLLFSPNGTNTARSNASVCDGSYHRMIILEDTGAGTSTMYIDGTAQTTTSIGVPSSSPWGSGIVVGSYTTGSYRNNGPIAALGFAQDSSAFSGADITALDAALAAYL